MAYFPDQPLKVLDADRIKNRIDIVDESNNTTLNANRVMHLADKMLSGGYRNCKHTWSYAGVSPNDRPTIASTPALQIGEEGFNTDFNGVEIYTGPTYGWYVIFGVWTTLTRPHETSFGANDLAPGSTGFNVDGDKETREYWDGSIWRSV